MHHDIHTHINVLFLLSERSLILSLVGFFRRLEQTKTRHRREDVERTRRRLTMRNSIEKGRKKAKADCPSFSPRKKKHSLGGGFRPKLSKRWSSCLADLFFFYFLISFNRRRLREGIHTLRHTPKKKCPAFQLDFQKISPPPLLNNGRFVGHGRTNITDTFSHELAMNN